MWGPAVLDFLQFQRFTQGRTEKYVDEQARYLQRWGERKAFFGLDSFTQDEVEAFLADLQRGEVTTKLVIARDEEGQGPRPNEEHRRPPRPPSSRTEEEDPEAALTSPPAAPASPSPR